MLSKKVISRPLCTPHTIRSVSQAGFLRFSYDCRVFCSPSCLLWLACSSPNSVTSLPTELGGRRSKPSVSACPISVQAFCSCSVRSVLSIKLTQLTLTPPSIRDRAVFVMFPVIFVEHVKMDWSLSSLRVHPEKVFPCLFHFSLDLSLSPVSLADRSSAVSNGLVKAEANCEKMRPEAISSIEDKHREEFDNGPIIRVNIRCCYLNSIDSRRRYIGENVYTSR